MHALRRTRSSAAALGGVLAAGLLAPWATPAQAAPTPASFTCTLPMFSRTMAYPTTAELTAQRVSPGSVQLTMKLGSMPGLAPVPLNGAATGLTVTATVAGQPVTLTGSHSVTVGPSAPIPMPVVTGTAATSAASLPVTVTKVDAMSSAMGLDVAVHCTPDGPFSRTVAVAEAAAPTKASSTTTVKTTVSKKKVATVSVGVKGSRGTATGKVKVTVKKGKKVVKSSTLTLRKGKAAVKTKRLKKGRYGVTVSYAGSSAYKASSRKAAFRVR